MRRLHANMLLLTAALIWGVTFSIQQMAMAHIAPTVFTGLRFTMGACVVLPFALAEARKKRRNEGWRFDKKSLPWLTLTGAVLFLAAWLQQIGIPKTTVANAGFLTALYVPFTPLLAFLVLRQTPHPAIWPAAAACIGGAYLMSGGTLDSMRPGDIWVLASSVFWATHILLIGAMTARVGAPFVISCIQFATCGVLGLIWGGLTESLSWANIVGAWPMLAFSGILSVGMGFTLQVVGQRHTPAADASIILSGETVFAAIAGSLLLGETLSPLDIQGCALILGGVLSVELLPLTLSKLKTRRTTNTPI
ncbi:MAG: DMT family transporter [Rhodospirillaceae bacterium]|nr:DMT family transporter [Rhodospirillaceae bacterium]